MALPVHPQTGTVHLAQHGMHAFVAGRPAYFGTVAGYMLELGNGEDLHTQRMAKQAGLDVQQYIARRVAHGILRTMARAKDDPSHRLHWVNRMAATLYGDRSRYEAEAAERAKWPSMEFGDTVVLEGVVYTLQPAPNDNVALVAQQPKADTVYL